MIDPTSAFVGLFVGTCIGVFIGTLRAGKVIDRLKDENVKLDRDLRKLTTRGSDGRFIRLGK
jgi:hypothetical protein